MLAINPIFIILGLIIVSYFVILTPLINYVFYRNKIKVGLKALNDPYYLHKWILKHPFQLVCAIVFVLEITWQETFGPIILSEPFTTINNIIIWFGLACCFYLFIYPALQMDTLPKVK